MRHPSRILRKEKCIEHKSRYQWAPTFQNIPIGIRIYNGSRTISTEGAHCLLINLFHSAKFNFFHSRTGRMRRTDMFCKAIDNSYISSRPPSNKYQVNIAGNISLSSCRSNTQSSRTNSCRSGRDKFHTPSRIWGRSTPGSSKNTHLCKTMSTWSSFLHTGTPTHKTSICTRSGIQGMDTRKFRSTCTHSDSERSLKDIECSKCPPKAATLLCIRSNLRQTHNLYSLMDMFSTVFTQSCCCKICTFPKDIPAGIAPNGSETKAPCNSNSKSHWNSPGRGERIDCICKPRNHSHSQSYQLIGKTLWGSRLRRIFTAHWIWIL